VEYDDRRFFATAAKGTEVVLRDELRAKRFRKIRADRGGVHFEGSRKFAQRACLELRTAIRVLEELATFDAPNGDALYEGVRNVDFAPFVDAKCTLAVRASLSNSELTHSQFVAQRVKDAVVDQIRDKSGARPDVDREDPDLALFVRIKKDVATLYADLGGHALHLRGYRTAQVEAPLKETLAASLLSLAGFDGTQAFLDPMCGSGTIAIEAAMMGQGIAPGLLTDKFGFERWRRHDATEKEEMAAHRARLRVEKKEGPDVLARDVDDNALRIARENARRAGVRIRTIRGPVEEVDKALEGRVVVTNPPYGERLEIDPEAIRSVGRALGSLRGGTVGVIAGEPEILRAIPRRPTHIHPIMNGDIECRFAVYAD
jgi:putative N6-adenine-specific DNA methylase